MQETEFYLHFIEGYHEEEPRRCSQAREIAFGDYGEYGLLVHVDPPCSGMWYRNSEFDMHYLLVSAMFEGQSISPIQKWPMNVYVFAPLIEDPEKRDFLSLKEVKKIAFGEIHRRLEREVDLNEKVITQEMVVPRKLRIDRILFIGEDQSEFGNELKKTLSLSFSSSLGVSKAFLVHMEYEKSIAQNLALCLRGGERNADQIVHYLERALQGEKDARRRIDVLFLSDDELLEVSLVSKAFFECC